MTNFRASFYSSIVMCTVSLFSSVAFAAPWSENTPSLEVSEKIVIGGTSSSLLLTLQAKPNSYYKIGKSVRPGIFENNDDDFEIEDGAEIIASGRLNKEGKIVIPVNIPASTNSRLYFQAATGGTSLYNRPKKFGFSASGISAPQSVLFVNSIAGTQGIQGEQGIQGPVGATGADGVQGLKGDTGAMGPQGIQGETGAKGDIGLTGPAGPQGIQGLQGEKGDSGIQGLTGAKGDTGLTGANGEKGDVGATGAQGLQGVQGESGVQGLAGAKGETGLTGPKGDKGDIGLSGPQGSQGIQGEKGEIGLQGLTGAKGDIGATGTKGDKGDVGLTGPQGIAGIQGEIGAKGDTGLTGVKGDKGDKGDTGATGLQGIQGLQGTAGPKGDTGASGPQGIQGQTGAQGIPGNPLTCPPGWRDLGPSCLEPDFNSTGKIDQAIQECFLQGAFVCSEQELSFACMNDAAMGFTFPENLFVHSGSVSVRTINSSSFVAYSVYRKINGLCFGPDAFNSPNATTSYDLYGQVRNYACCLRK